MWTAIVNFFKGIFSTSEQAYAPTNVAGETRNEMVLKMAASQLGVKETSGSGSNKKVEEYLDYGASSSNKDSGLSDATPWCAGFVGWCLEKVGMGSTNTLMARSYEKWGVSSRKDPLPGDIVVFYRNGKSSGSGHVTFFVKKVGDYIYCLGGNQSDEVNITRYSSERLTDIRRSSKAGAYDAIVKSRLRGLAEDLLSGRSIGTGGKVA